MEKEALSLLLLVGRRAREGRQRSGQGGRQGGQAAQRAGRQAWRAGAPPAEADPREAAELRKREERRAWVALIIPAGAA